VGDKGLLYYLSLTFDMMLMQTDLNHFSDNAGFQQNNACTSELFIEGI
jgi:hypothetical protein